MQGSSQLRTLPHRESVRLEKHFLAAQSFRSRHTFRRKLRELCQGSPQLCQHAEVQSARSNATEVLQVGTALTCICIPALHVCLAGADLHSAEPCTATLHELRKSGGWHACMGMLMLAAELITDTRAECCSLLQ